MQMYIRPPEILVKSKYAYLVHTDNVVERLVARLRHVHVGGRHELGVGGEVEEAVHDNRDEEPLHGELHQAKQLFLVVVSGF